MNSTDNNSGQNSQAPAASVATRLQDNRIQRRMQLVRRSLRTSGHKLKWINKDDEAEYRRLTDKWCTTELQ